MKALQTIRPSRLSTAALASTAALLLAVGMGAYRDLLHYQATPTAGAQAPLRWPTRSRLHRATNRPTVVLFAHTGCPCTRASLRELSWVAAQKALEQAPELHIVLVSSPELATAVEEFRKAVPTASVITLDRSGEADLFGARSSGQVMAFDQTGRLRFSGGITGSRGHEGENWGTERLTAALRQNGNEPPTHFPVFGCALSGVSTLARSMGEARP